MPVQIPSQDGVPCILEIPQIGLVAKPKIKLITECIYLDDIERSKFSSSKLEYVIELFQENLFDLNRRLLFNT